MSSGCLERGGTSPCHSGDTSCCVLMSVACGNQLRTRYCTPAHPRILRPSPLWTQRVCVLQVRQLKSRGWEGEAASLAEREQQLQGELASSGAPPGAAAPSVAASGGPDWRPLPDVETELLRVQRCSPWALSCTSACCSMFVHLAMADESRSHPLHAPMHASGRCRTHCKPKALIGPGPH